jgi:hypothetical protein
VVEMTLVSPHWATKRKSTWYKGFRAVCDEEWRPFDCLQADRLERKIEGLRGGAIRWGDLRLADLRLADPSTLNEHLARKSRHQATMSSKQAKRTIKPPKLNMKRTHSS